MEKLLVETIRSAADHSLDTIKNHRFVKCAESATLERNQVLRWIMCAGRESKTFPTILEFMISRSENSAVTKILQENLDDEFGNGNLDQAHFNHYIHLLNKIGLTKDDFEQYVEGPGILYALALAQSVATRQNSATAIGYMLVNEGMTPITYAAVDIALHKYYPELATSFFQLHVEVDEHHVEELYKAVAAMPDATVNDIIYGVHLGERGMAVLLDEALGALD